MCAIPRDAHAADRHQHPGAPAEPAAAPEIAMLAAIGRISLR
jgi:hypothetical protein